MTVRSQHKTAMGQMRREINGVLLVALGLLGYLSLIFPASGVLGRDLGRGLTLVFGMLAWVVPAGAIGAGLLDLANRPDPARRRRSWGVVLGFLGMAILAALTGRTSGGWIGFYLLRFVAFGLGHPGSLILGLLLLLIGSMLVTGITLAAGGRRIGHTVFRVVKMMVQALVRVIVWLRDWVFPVEETPPEVMSKVPRKSSASRKVPAEDAVPLITEGHPAVAQTEPVPPSPPVRLIQPSMFAAADPYLPPPLSLLSAPIPARPTQRGQSAEQRGRILVESLRQFGIEVRLADVSQGPAITRFEIVPPPGVKVSRIVNLADDIALSLAATGVRIEAPIPGKSAIGIEVPNDQIAAVLLRDVLETNAFGESDSFLTVALGRDVAGAPIVARLDEMPHLLVAGATGSGKSVLINVLITSLLLRTNPHRVRLLLIDPKVVELSIYNGIPHLISPVVTEPKKAAGALRWAVQEMENRYRMFAATGVRDVTRYNQTVRDEDKLPLVVIIIDELADLMMVAPQDVEESIARLAQMARAAGLHLVVATQRPSVDVITGTIKANIPSRIAFAVSSQVDSRTILDTAGAEKLLGRGDMLFSPVGSAKPVRVQGAFVTEKEIERVVQYLREHSVAVEPSTNAPDFSSSGADADVTNEPDSLFLDAIRIVIESRQASTSMLQRRMHIGYTRAARLIDAMEARGYIGPADGARPRDVLISDDQYRQLLERATPST
ncbi:MAG: DNA translocase FtsK [Sulfobacillus acidophilus]|uniref:DNA translocase FtsK n=1 Tax=Sulfobacillus acidophilus TaxID=53633 RepID=A0A2T2WNK7_9FIRM|nr:MAG: DNA translocase FtsK [Sulfobacillus acidophilus]